MQPIRQVLSITLLVMFILYVDTHQRERLDKFLDRFTKCAFNVLFFLNLVASIHIFTSNLCNPTFISIENTLFFLSSEG